MENIQITNVRSLGPWEWDFTEEGVVDVSGVPQAMIDSIPDIQVSAPNITSPTTLTTTITAQLHHNQKVVNGCNQSTAPGQLLMGLQ